MMQILSISDCFKNRTSVLKKTIHSHAELTKKEEKDKWEDRSSAAVFAGVRILVD